MSKHSQQFTLEVPPEEAMAACRSVAGSLGWLILEQDAWSLTLKEPGTSLAHVTWRAKVHIRVGSPPAGSGSVVVLDGSNSPGAGPIQKQHIKKQVATVQDAIVAAAQAAGPPDAVASAGQTAGAVGQTAGPVPVGQAPAAWYPDPTAAHAQRYWDGTQWTEHVFDPGGQSVDPLGGSV